MWTLQDKEIDTYLSSSGKIYPHYVQGAEYTRHSIDTGHVFRRDIPNKRYEAFIKFSNTFNTIMYYIQDYSRVSHGIESWMENGEREMHSARGGVTYVCKREGPNRFFIGCLNLGLEERFQWTCHFYVGEDGNVVYNPNLGGGYSQTEVKNALFALFKHYCDDMEIVKLDN